VKRSWIFALIFFSNHLLWAQYGIPRESRFEEHLHSVQLDRVDLSILRKEAETRVQASSEQELNRILTRNFQHIFMNRLNRNRFIIPPKPEDVASHIVEVLNLNRELEHLIEEGNRIRDGNRSSVEMKRIISAVKKTAEDLNRSFQSYFVEVNPATYSMVLSSRGDAGDLFRFYMYKSKAIHDELTASLNRYFFSNSPVAVDLDDYGIVSIEVLSKSLSKLSDSYGRMLAAKP